MTKRLWRVSRFVLLCSLPLAVGCGTGWGCGGGGARKVKFNESLAAKYNLKDEELPKIQFYLGGELVLTREIEPENMTTEVTKGQLVQREGKTIEEIVVKKGTPGKCLSTESKDGQHTLEITFKEGTSFKFVRGPSDSGYTIVGKTNGDSVEVQIGGNTYQTTKKQVEGAYLEVSEEKVEKYVKNREEYPGVTVGE